MIHVYAFFVFLVTTCIGSFLNVVIYRLPNGMSVAKPPSHCPKCDHMLKWYDNIPIISYITLGGKCRYCGCKITPRYLIVELLTGIISTLIFYRFGISFTSLYGIILFLVLIPISFIDIEHLIIFDRFIIILLVLGVSGIFFNDLNYGNGTLSIGWLDKLIGAGSIIVFGLIIILLEKLFKKYMMGGGDLKLMFAAGLILGWQLLALSVGIASILACIVEIAAKLIKQKKAIPEKAEEQEEKILSDEEAEIAEFKEQGLFPFGPYLAIGFMIAYVFGLNLLEGWFSLLAL